MRNLSVAPGNAVPAQRDLAVLDEIICRRLAEQCLKADTLGDVRALLGRPAAQGATTPPVDADEAMDPVCGMVVHTADTPYALRVGGVAHFFCSRSCLMRFMNHRETKEGEANTDGGVH
ncbi:MAG: hypothetical protein ABFS39_10955 [Pseudomonadota bacterium]